MGETCCPGMFIANMQSKQLPNLLSRRTFVYQLRLRDVARSSRLLSDSARGHSVGKCSLEHTTELTRRATAAAIESARAIHGLTCGSMVKESATMCHQNVNNRQGVRSGSWTTSALTSITVCNIDAFLPMILRAFGGRNHWKPSQACLLRRSYSSRLRQLIGSDIESVISQLTGMFLSEVIRDLERQDQDLLVEALRYHCEWNPLFHRKLRKAIHPMDEQNPVDARPAMSSTDQLKSSKKCKSDDTAAGPSNTIKRVKPVAANCSNCGVPFVVGDDQDAPCQYHPGHLEARDDDEEDFWADHEEDHFGEIGRNRQR
jgi:hypothetical protein